MAKIVVDTKNAVGKVYFANGDIEEITGYIIYADDNIVFYTETGKYAYRRFFEPILDCERFIMDIPRSRFYKSRITMGDISFNAYTPVEYNEDWFHVDIDRIELLEVK